MAEKVVPTMVFLLALTSIRPAHAEQMKLVCKEPAAYGGFFESDFTVDTNVHTMTGIDGKANPYTENGSKITWTEKGGDIKVIWTLDRSTLEAQFERQYSFDYSATHELQCKLFRRQI